MTASRIVQSAFALVLAGGGLAMALQPAHAANKLVERGKYLVTLASCTDCHTPGHFFGKEDATKFLGGSDVGFAIPGLGVFVAPNLTPDKATGLGNFTTQQIVTAITAGKLPDGRMLAPTMPYEAYAKLTRADALAIVAYLRSLKPVQNQVPGPFGPKQQPTVFVMAVIPGAVYSSLPPPPPPPGAPPASAPAAAPAAPPAK